MLLIYLAKYHITIITLNLNIFKITNINHNKHKSCIDLFCWPYRNVSKDFRLRSLTFLNDKYIWRFLFLVFNHRFRFLLAFFISLCVSSSSSLHWHEHGFKNIRNCLTKFQQLLVPCQQLVKEPDISESTSFYHRHKSFSTELLVLFIESFVSFSITLCHCQPHVFN